MRISQQAGSMGTSIVNPSIYLAGASGGVYALITAHIATIIMVIIAKLSKPIFNDRFIKLIKLFFFFRIGMKWNTRSFSYSYS